MNLELLVLLEVLLHSFFAPCFAPAPEWFTDGNIFPPAREISGGHSLVALDEATFKFTSVGHSSEMLQRAFLRAKAYAFANGPGKVNSSLPLLSAVKVNVTTPVDTLNKDTDEGYSISVSPTAGEANIEAATVYGAMHGLMSFAQMVQFHVTERWYCVADVQVKDYPEFEYRSVMVDTGRIYISTFGLKQLCDVMELAKYNNLNIHLTDTQSWPVVVEGYPRLTEVSSYAAYAGLHVYDGNNTADLVSHCLDRGVRIVPEIDSPGHFGAAEAYPEYFVCLQRNSSGGCAKRGLFDFTSEEAWGFMEAIWSTVMGYFPGGEYHIGGDEVPNGGWDCPEVKAWMQKYSSGCPDDPHIACNDTSSIHPYITRRLISLIRKANPRARIQGWNPGVSDFYSYGNVGTRYPFFSFQNWNGYSVAGIKGWQKSMNTMTGEQNASVVLSGPYYLVQPKFPECLNPPSHDLKDWHQMMHVDPLNFTGTPEQKSKVRGAMLTIWGDTGKADAGSVVQIASQYMLGMSLQLWSYSVKPIDPDDPTHMTCNGGDYTPCHEMDAFRCKAMAMTGIEFTGVGGIGHMCPIPFQGKSVGSSALEDGLIRRDREIAHLRHILAQFKSS